MCLGFGAGACLVWKHIGNFVVEVYLLFHPFGPVSPFRCNFTLWVVRNAAAVYVWKKKLEMQTPRQSCKELGRSTATTCLDIVCWTSCFSVHISV